MDFFLTLGARVDALWQQQDYDEARFPKVALQALEEFPPNKHTSLLDVVNGATKASCLPTQNDMAATFGDPPLTVYEGRNFRIEVLFWLRGVPGVHQHAFSGAFHVLEGSSIHTRWRFLPEERVDMRLILGRVEFTDVEILLPGDNREILAGPSMYHATYHMDKPSLTVVVRTPGEADKHPQYLLTPPFVASAPFNRQDTVVRQAQLLNMLLQVQPAECLEHLRRLLSVKDGYWTYEVLNMLWRSIDDEDARQQLLATARQRHPRLMRALESSLDRSSRGDRIMRLRIDIGDDPELRYLLALLRNVPDGSEICRLVALRHPGRNVSLLIESWVRRLAASGALGFNMHDSWIVTLRLLLEGSSDDQVAEHFARAPAASGNPRDPDEVHELCAALRTSWLFHPLFAPSRASAA